MKSGMMWKFWYVSINFFCSKYPNMIIYICYLLFLSKSYWKIWEILAWNMIKISLCEKMALCSKINWFQNLSVGKKICSKNFFLLIQSNWVKRSKKITIFCKMQHFVAILKIGISLAAIWTFLWWLRCHLTPILLITGKIQCISS